MALLSHTQTKNQIEAFLKLPSHALVLSGENGAGKGMVARYIAARVLADKIDKVTTHPYVFLLDAKNEKAGIDDIRKLQTFLKLKVPGEDRIKRAVILENIDYLRHEAQNALLKIAEEPPEDTIIIATYVRRGQVLATIRSRMQQIVVLPISPQYLQAALKGQFSQESIRKACHMSGGQAGLMLAILNDEKNHELVSAISEARSLIGMSRYQRLSMVDKLVKNKEIQPPILLDGLYRLITAAYKNSLIAEVKEEESKAHIHRLKLLERSINDLNQNVQAKLVLSRLFMEL